MQARLQNRTYDRDRDRTKTAGARPQHSGELLGEHVEAEAEVVIFEPYATIIQQTSNSYQINKYKFLIVFISAYFDGVCAWV